MSGQIWLEKRVKELEGQVTELEKERVRLQGYQCDIVGKEVAKLTKGMMPIPKPLTDEKIYECYRAEFDILLTDSGAQNTIKRFAKAVERAHGIGEKE